MNSGTHPEFTSGSHLSYWTDSVKPIQFDKLKKNLETDVVIIGGGISGLSVAYNLCLQGQKVVLVEDGYIGSGETGRTTAHLVTALDDRYFDLERIYGEDNVKLIAESHMRAIDFVEQTVQKENIDCDFTRLDGYLFLHPNDDEPDTLEKEYEAAKRAGLSVEKVSAMPGIDDNSPAILFREQATFHPLKYLQGLCRAIVEKGGLIFTNTHAKEIDETGIETDDGYKVKAKNIVVATNSPVNHKTRMHLKQYPYRTYVIGALVRKGTLPNVLWWDTGDSYENEDIPPYHYVRLQPYNELYDLLICGGEDHPTGEPNVIVEENRYSRLVTWARRRFNFSEIVYRWSGQVLEPMDGLAFIGHSPGKDNIYIVTGDSGNGMTHGTIAGLLLTDLVLKKENPWKKIYNPARFKLLKAGGTFFREIGSMLVDYYMHKPQNAEEKKLSTLEKGRGEIVELDGDKYGAFRDDDDKVHLVSAECMHLGCIVKWNNDEKTWDCPCHGSRFTSEGKVINGPANNDLKHFIQGEPKRKGKATHQVKHDL